MSALLVDTRPRWVVVAIPVSSACAGAAAVQVLLLVLSKARGTTAMSWVEGLSTEVSEEMQQGERLGGGHLPVSAGISIWRVPGGAHVGKCTLLDCLD